ncbi:MAG: structural protein P5 [Bacteroidaceae bacterium]|nr:structural protein P5 [Bacteroidaceae bacterium]
MESVSPTKTAKDMAAKLPRGIRNNNPLNIRKGLRWLGLRDFPTDKEFCEFQTMAFGFRAAFRTLVTYYTKHDCKTLEKIINRWAPPQENDSFSYINNVRVKARVFSNSATLPDPRLKCNWPIWRRIIMAMASVENGKSMSELKKYEADLGKGMKMVFM